MSMCPELDDIINDQDDEISRLQDRVMALTEVENALREELAAAKLGQSLGARRIKLETIVVTAQKMVNVIRKRHAMPLAEDFHCQHLKAVDEALKDYTRG